MPRYADPRQRDRRAAAWLLRVAALALASPAVAEERPADMQRGGTFYEPPARVDPAYLPPGPNLTNEASRQLHLRLSADVPFRTARPAAAGRGAQGSPPAAPALQLAGRWQPVAGEPWFMAATLYRYLDEGRRQLWNPDFTYGFGYDDPRPGTWTLTYWNYAGNRFHPDRQRGEGRSNFSQGQWSLGQRFGLPAAAQEIFLTGDGDHASCDWRIHLTPRYTDLDGGALRRHKTALSAGCRYTRPEGFFAHLTLLAYPRRDQQQPWDPDYTWGVGFAHRTLSIQYSNYSGNRFPGRHRSPGQGGLRDGSVTVSWDLPW